MSIKEHMRCRGFLLLVDELLLPDTQFSMKMELAGMDEGLLTAYEVVWISENISIHSKAHKDMRAKPSGFRFLEKQGK